MSILLNTVGILQLLSLGLLLLNIVLMMRHSAEARSCKSRVLLGSFAERANFQAMMGSWFVTFLAISAISEWSEPEVLLYGPRDPASLFPPTYYLHVLLSCMLISYSLLYFFFNWRAGAGEETDTE